MTALLDVTGMTVTLPTRAGKLQAVRGVDLSVSRGETLCIVGESGCGKSMTALGLLGLLPKGADLRFDRFRFNDADMVAGGRRAVAALRGRSIGMIFQEPMTALNPTFTVGSQLTAVYRQHVADNERQAKDRAMDLLERVGITNAALRLRQYPHQLSGGLRQRILIAMALMAGPRLIVADEPTTALDVTVQMQILKLLQDLQAEEGLGLILISHDLGVVARIADRIAVMYAGQTIEVGCAPEILRNPQHPYTAGLLASVPRPDPAHRGNPLGMIPGTVPILTDPPAACGFAPRCDRRRADCLEGVPPLEPVDRKVAGPSGRLIRCRHPLSGGEGWR